MHPSDFSYDLPPHLVAQHPARRRDESRLLVMARRGDAPLVHTRFPDLLEYLVPGDCLVFNDAKVIPGRIRCHKRGTGGKVELLLMDPVGDPADPDGATWTTLYKASKRPRPGLELTTDRGDVALVFEEVGQGGVATVRFPGVTGEEVYPVIQRVGEVPLPPYIHRGDEGPTPDDETRYQTVYAAAPGAVAAPTAGLHFTSELLGDLDERGVERLHVTLHVGPGTFQPVKAASLEDHVMHRERFVLSEAVAERVNLAKQHGRRVVAVGTTSVRVLESSADTSGRVTPGAGSTDIFIYPPYRYKCVDGLVTNFHLPESTLVMLVAALAGKDRVLTAYEEAVREGYRFYSYGDAMLII